MYLNRRGLSLQKDTKLPKRRVIDKEMGKYVAPAKESFFSSFFIYFLFKSIQKKIFLFSKKIFIFILVNCNPNKLIKIKVVKKKQICEVYFESVGITTWRCFCFKIC